MPTRSTSNEIVSSVVRTLLTFAFGTFVTGGFASSGLTRAQSAGPEVASGTFQRSGLRYHVVAGPAVFGAMSWPGAGSGRSLP